MNKTTRVLIYLASILIRINDDDFHDNWNNILSVVVTINDNKS